MSDLSSSPLPLWKSNQVEGILEIQNGNVVSLNARATELLNIAKDQSLNLALIAVVRNHKIEEAYINQETIEVNSHSRVLKVSPCKIGLSIMDITELRKAKDHTRELLAVLSHELRTPVTTISSTIEALQYDLSDDKRTHFIERANTEVDRLIRLLDDLTVDVKPPLLRRLSLEEHIKRAANLLNKKLEENNISFEIETCDYYVYADSDKLLQVLINLIENAAIHGPNNSVVKITSMIQEEKLHIHVIDQGKPLAESIIEELFEPHSRGQGAKAKGTGLGLYIVRNIAKSWNGKAWGKALEKGNSFGFSVELV